MNAFESEIGSISVPYALFQRSYISPRLYRVNGYNILRGAVARLCDGVY